MSLRLCLFVAAGTVLAGEASWDQLIRQGERLCREGRFVEAEAVFLDALKEAGKVSAPNIRLAETQHYLGSVYRELGRLPEAEKWYQRSLDAWQTRNEDADRQVPQPLISLTSLYMENGLDAKAERLLAPWFAEPRPRFQAPDPRSARLLHNLAALQHRRRKYAIAESLYRDSLKAAQTVFGSHDPEVARILNNLGMLHVDAGRRDEAGPCLEQALAILESALGSSHPDVARALTNLAAFYTSTRSHAKAAPLFERALSIAETRLGSDNRLVGDITAEYAVALRKLKRKNEARLLEKRAQAIRQSHAPEQLGRHSVDFRDLQALRERARHFRGPFRRF
jgi:tetratricopeptide (TPR) repeat protein